MSAEKKSKYVLEDLLYLMQRLREPKTGCPWDLKQNWQTITASTIEEAYEVVDAIESENKNKIKEELGDLLFQVVFYSQFAKEENEFTFHDVVDAIVSKLVFRHPHVFPGNQLSAKRSVEATIDEEKINRSWEELKKQERSQRGERALLADIPQNLPAMLRAEKMQKRASKVGFDWPDLEGILDKLTEEIQEFKQAIHHEDKNKQEEELGDVIFTCVNLARYSGLDAETALRRANQKFYARLGRIEKMIGEEGRKWEDCDLQTLEAHWKKAKQDEA